MTKRILSLLLAAMMVLGSLVVVSAAETDYAAENTWAVEVLSKLDVLQGDENGDPMLDNAILRYEMALFLARALTGKTDDAYWAKVENETPFDDLLTHPYNGAATWNYNHGIILGVTDTIFNPNGNITYQDAIVMVVRAWADYFLVDGLASLGIKDELHYPWKHIELADDLGLTKNIDPTEKYLENTTRGVVAQLVYNLLTWKNPALLDNLDANLLRKNQSIGEAKFDLTASNEGVKATVTAIANDGEVTTNPAIAGLTKATFEQFETEAKVDAVYTIVYYSVGDETVVYSIKQVSKDDAGFVNTPAGRTFDIVYEATAWKDNDKSKDATEWKITGITVDGTLYSIHEGKDALTFVVDYVTGYTYETKNLDKDEVKEIEAVLDSLYGTLKLSDTTGNGKVDTLTLTPYVFAAIYAEVDADTSKADNKDTTCQFAGYAVVSHADAEKTTSGAAILKDACKNANGDKIDFAVTGATTEYVAKATAATLATAEKLSLVTIDKYDIRANVTNYFQIAGSVYGYKYTNLLGWDAAASYYAVANNGDLLAKLYANKGITDDTKIPTGEYKYVNAYVLDGNLVALDCVAPDGTTTPSTPSTPTAEYAGIIDLEGTLNAAAPKYDADVIKNVNGAYYLKTNATVNGVKIADLLVYLGKATTYEFDITNSKSPADQQKDWQDAQNTSIKTGYDKLVALAGANAFYTVDANGNYVVVTDVAVTGEAYLTHVGGAALIAPADKTKQNITNLQYTMDRASEDFITYTFSETGKADAPKYALNIATAETVWLFVTADDQRLEVGVPEYNSQFSVAKYTDIVKNGNTIVVFAAPTNGFNYTMYQDATYAIYNGSTALDMGVRDGYYYYTAKNLFTGKNFIMKVLETSPMVAELDKAAKAAAAGAQSDIIIAVTNDTEHELLETYKIEKGTIAAIASLTYGTSSFEDLGKDYTTDALEARIKAQYNLTAVQAMLMEGTINTLVGGTLTLNATGTIAGDYYVFYTPASGDTAASYVVFICG